MKRATCIVVLCTLLHFAFPMQPAFAQSSDSFPAFVNNDELIDRVSLIDGQYWVALGRPDLTFSPHPIPISTPSGGWIEQRPVNPRDPTEKNGAYFLPAGEISYLEEGSSRTPLRENAHTLQSDDDFTLRFLEPADHTPYEGLPQSIRMDIDNDGRIEWITWEMDHDAETSSLLIYRQSGDDQWVLEETYPPSSYKPTTNYSLIGFTDLCAADFDCDGYIEMYYRSGGEAFIWKWLGPGEYEEYITSRIGTSGDGVPIVSDLDSDGVPDITVTTTQGSILEGYVYYFLTVTEFAGIGDYYDGWKYYMQSDIIQDVMIPPGLTQAAVGDIDRDGDNEIVFSRLPVSIPTPTDANCYYMDKNSEGEYEIHSIQSKETGYLEMPVIADIDQDGYDEWIANGISLYTDGTPNTPVVRIIDSDAEGNLYESYLDTSVIDFSPAQMAFAQLHGDPVIVGASFWADPDEDYQYTDLFWTLINFADPNNATEIAHEYTHVRMNPSQVLAGDIDHDGLFDMSFSLHGGSDRFAIYEESQTNDIEEPEFIPNRPLIASVYPNPANAFVSIQINQPFHTTDKLLVFDITGRLVDSILLPHAPGSHTVTWNAKNMPSGTYFLSTPNSETRARKITIIK